MASLHSSPAVKCMKLLMTIFNIVFWTSGLVILAVGVWMKLELYVYMELTDVYYDSAPYILIGVGCAIIVVGSFGCLCTVKGYPAFLYFFSVTLLVVFVVELATAVSTFVYKTRLSGGFHSGLQLAMETYNNQSTKREAVDGIQRAWKCCGNDDYADWYDINWSGSGLTETVPNSCCKNMAVCDTSATGTDDIYVEGCFSKLSAFMEKNFLMIGGIAIGFAFLQLFGALLACCLAKNINRAKYEQMA